MPAEADLLAMRWELETKNTIQIVSSGKEWRDNPLERAADRRKGLESNKPSKEESVLYENWFNTGSQERKKEAIKIKHQMNVAEN